MKAEIFNSLARASGIRIYDGKAQSDNAWKNGFDRVLESDLQRFADIVSEYERNQCAKTCIDEGSKHNEHYEVQYRLMAQDCAQAIKSRNELFDSEVTA